MMPGELEASGDRSGRFFFLECKGAWRVGACLGKDDGTGDPLNTGGAFGVNAKGRSGLQEEGKWAPAVSSGVPEGEDCKEDVERFSSKRKMAGSPLEAVASFRTLSRPSSLLLWLLMLTGEGLGFREDGTGFSSAGSLVMDGRTRCRRSVVDDMAGSKEGCCFVVTSPIALERN